MIVVALVSEDIALLRYLKENVDTLNGEMGKLTHEVLLAYKDKIRRLENEFC